jgi:dihydropteroate synthase
LNNLKKFSNLGFNILSGISRKSMIGDILNVPPSDRLYGTIAASVIAIKNQTNILRVHDVRETSILLNFRDLIKNS